MISPVLLADCVSKAFGERRVLTSASLRAHAGELRVLFGRNGAGKSTLLKIAAGLLPADTGTVHFCERAYLAPHLWILARRGLFYLPDRDLFSSSLRVRQQLDIVRECHRGLAVEKAAATLGIQQLLDRRPSELSTGERRRAEFAAVLVRQPICLLADEPLRGVSPIDAEVLLATLRQLRSAGTAIVVTGHDTSSLLEASDHVSWCTSGTTYELGHPSTAIHDWRFRDEYLGTKL